MRNPPALRFRGGQFVSMAVGDTPLPQIGGGGQTAPPLSGTANGTSPARRSYSIASPSNQSNRLRFIIRVIPDGTASDYLMSLALGAEVRMTGPHGFFVLDPQHPGDIVFGATGTGVSAVLPMLSELAGASTGTVTAVPVAGRRLLYWGVRHEADLFARAEIEALCREARCDLRLYLTSPPTGWHGEQGRITAAILAAYPRLKSPTFYLVGNGAMISELKRELIALGVNRKKQIRTEAFFD